MERYKYTLCIETSLVARSRWNVQKQKKTAEGSGSDFDAGSAGVYWYGVASFKRRPHSRMYLCFF